MYSYEDDIYLAFEELVLNTWPLLNNCLNRVTVVVYSEDVLRLVGCGFVTYRRSCSCIIAVVLRSERKDLLWFPSTKVSRHSYGVELMGYIYPDVSFFPSVAPADRSGHDGTRS
jgi:hypothetical protein